MMNRIVCLSMMAFGVACGSQSEAVASHSLVSLEQGDAACYVELKSLASGETEVYPSSFTFCEGGEDDLSGLVGQDVSVTLDKGQIADCEGPPDCGRFMEVERVASVVAATGPAAAAVAPAAEPPSTPKATHVLMSIEQGDAACYLNVKGIDSSEVKGYPSSFEFCEEGAKDLTGSIGKNVVISTKTQLVSDCEGPPDCGRFREEEGIDSVVVID